MAAMSPEEDGAIPSSGITLARSCCYSLLNFEGLAQTLCPLRACKLTVLREVA